MASNLNWELYRTFLAVLTEGSLSGAARALGITQPTAGRHVEALEAAFGQPLFTRSRRMPGRLSSTWIRRAAGIPQQRAKAVDGSAIPVWRDANSPSPAYNRKILFPLAATDIDCRFDTLNSGENGFWRLAQVSFVPDGPKS